MTQALGKVNVTKTEKNDLVCQKMLFFSKFQFLAKSSFLKKSCLLAKPNLIHLPNKPPHSGPHEVRNCRDAAVPEKETKILEGAHLTKMKAQYQTFQTRYSLFLWYA